jgi:ATP-dependent Lhr-like helicase
MRIRFLFRGEGNAFLELPPENLGQDLAELSEDAQAVMGFLKQEGAAFVADVAAANEWGEERAVAALWELAAMGLATNDSLPSLRDMLQFGPSAGGTTRKPLSSLETELAERLAQQRAAHQPAGFSRRPTFGGAGQRPSRDELTAARRRVAERLAQGTEPAKPLRHEGRWTLVHRFAVLGKPLSPAEVAARQARQLLLRHGVVTHASLEDESGTWDWGFIYPELQRLEMRGEVRRGYFVRGLPGVQFALPEVVEQLRSGAAAAKADAPVVVLNACDPANLYGQAGEWRIAGGEPLSFAHIPSTFIALGGGRPLLLIGDSGSSLTVVEGTDSGQIRQALASWLAHAATFESHLSVTTWNGQSVLGSPGQALLETVGFYRDYQAMTWERSRGAGRKHADPDA